MEKKIAVFGNGDEPNYAACLSAARTKGRPVEQVAGCFSAQQALREADMDAYLCAGDYRAVRDYYSGRGFQGTSVLPAVWPTGGQAFLLGAPPEGPQDEAAARAIIEERWGSVPEIPKRVRVKAQPAFLLWDSEPKWGEWANGRAEIFRSLAGPGSKLLLFGAPPEVDLPANFDGRVEESAKLEDAWLLIARKASRAFEGMIKGVAVAEVDPEMIWFAASRRLSDFANLKAAEAPEVLRICARIALWQCKPDEVAERAAAFLEGILP